MSVPSAAPRALVLGSGAQGLVCALRLWAEGWDTVVLARDELEDTVSWGAGAAWTFPPFHVEPEEASRRWVLASLGPLQTLAAEFGPDECGARMRTSYYLFRDPATGREALRSATNPPGALLDLKEGLPPEGVLRPDTQIRYAFSYRAPVVSMSKFLPWLSQKLVALGVRFEAADLRSAADVAEAERAHQADLLVNCLGLGAGLLFGDAAVHGVLGDLVYVRANGLGEESFAHLSDEDHPGGLAYVIPQVGGIVAMGGTAVRVDELEVASLAHGPAAEARREGIRARCREVFGEALVGGEVLGSWAGLRPQRSGGVRLELDETGGAASLGPVIHNYGHGGAGIMTAWGCAADVVSLASGVASTRGLELRGRALPPGLGAVVAATGRGAAGAGRARL